MDRQNSHNDNKPTGTISNTQRWVADEVAAKKGDALRSVSDLKEDATQAIDSTVDTAKQKSREYMKDAKDMAADAAQYGSEMADTAIKTVSKAVDKTVSKVEEGYDASRDYLANSDFSTITKDLTSFVKRHPLQTLAAGLGLGILIGNSLSRKSDS